MADKVAKYHQEIQQMLFVSGETEEPSADTTWLIEEIVREQVIEILSRATTLANRRGTRTISHDDLIFIIRHDKAKVSRLRTFLSWKDVRKNIKETDDKGGADIAEVGIGELPVEPSTAHAATGGPAETGRKVQGGSFSLPWGISSFFSEKPPGLDGEDDDDEEDMRQANLQRLNEADDRTKNMTREEYAVWAECRQASFTWRKSKKFRDWAGFGTIIDGKPGDDVIDLLGFLTFDIVHTLTQVALKVKEANDLSESRHLETKQSLTAEGPFKLAKSARAAIERKHIQEAFRRLQQPGAREKAFIGLSHERMPLKRPLKLI